VFVTEVAVLVVEFFDGCAECSVVAHLLLDEPLGVDAFEVEELGHFEWHVLGDLVEGDHCQLDAGPGIDLGEELLVHVVGSVDHNIF